MKDSFSPANLGPEASEVPLVRHGGLPVLRGRMIKSLSLGCSKTLSQTENQNKKNSPVVLGMVAPL